MRDDDEGGSSERSVRPVACIVVSCSCSSALILESDQAASFGSAVIERPARCLPPDANNSYRLGFGPVVAYGAPAESSRVAFAAMKLMARSANAVMVSDGLTPGLADIAEPSMTYSPG